MLERFPPGKGNRHQRDAEAKGVRGTNRTEQLLMTPEGRREWESPRTWNIVGSRQVYFCRPDRLPGALCGGKRLYCLTRKGIKKAKGREGRWGFEEGGDCWPGSVPSRWVCSPLGMRHNQKQGCDDASWTDRQIFVCAPQTGYPLVLIFQMKRLFSVQHCFNNTGEPI